MPGFTKRNKRVKVVEIFAKAKRVCANLKARLIVEFKTAYPFTILKDYMIST